MPSRYIYQRVHEKCTLEKKAIERMNNFYENYRNEQKLKES